MWVRITAILVLVLSITNGNAFAQDTIAQNDSSLLYENIETYSERTWFTKFMFRLFFKPVAAAQAQKSVNKRLIYKPYHSFQGKTIRHINIITLDPFGNSIGDSIAGSLNFLTATGNRIHVKSRANSIRNLLLVRENQAFDSLLVKESERLVRSMKYVADVRFYTVAVPGTTDSVDIYIRELDNWSLIPGGAWSPVRQSVRLSENNFMGLGHVLQNEIIRNPLTGEFAYGINYYIPNIRNTFINTTLQYGNDGYGNFMKSFAMERPFVSPLTKWAGGVSFSQHLYKGSFRPNTQISFNYYAQDYWVGNSMKIFKGSSEYSRTTRFIAAGRFMRRRFIEKPPAIIDSLRFYSDENFYLASIGVSSRQYIKDTYVFKFGITEDVPVGKVIGLTGGYQEKNNAGGVYIGMRFSLGNYYSWGYLSSNLEFGTHLLNAGANHGVARAGANYFTKLIEIGPWKFRQFIKPQVTIGLQRSGYDSLTINNEFGLRGFNSPVLSGTSRLLLTSQTQSYAPWNFIGFRFGPYLNFSMAMLGEALEGFRGSKLYSQIGVGVLIKNDNLVMNSFQISISYYPIIPAKGYNVFLLNSFRTTDFGFRDFEIAKPAMVNYK